MAANYMYRMVYNLKPYPAYKDSGVPWLGEVPEHWDVRRLGSVTQILNGATPSSSRPEYWDGDIVWVTPDDLGKLKGRYIDNSSRCITQEGYNACGTTLAPAGSIVLSTRAPIGHLGILRVAACANQGCRLLVPQAATASEFLYHMLVAARPSLEVLGQGSTFLELSRSKLGTFPIPFPPLPEQTAIVRFLNWAEQRIRRVIRARQRRIKLLEEYKQALIHQAVTGQIDVRTGKPYPAYKPSGVEWLGDVPAHWEVQKLKRLGEVKIGLTYAPSDVTGDDGTLVLRASNIRDGAIVSADDVFVSKEVPQSLRVAEGDILICVRSGSKSLVGKVAIISPSFSGVTFGAFMSLLRSSLNPFIYWVFNSNMLTSVMAQFQTSTINQLTQNDLRNLDIPLPPLPEQTAIVEYLDARTAKIDAAIAATRREIELLREYRTRLIADVVTGKVDVREVAAQLPEEPPEEEAELMDTEEIAGGEATDEESGAEALSEEVEP